MPARWRRYERTAGNMELYDAQHPRARLSDLPRAAGWNQTLILERLSPLSILLIFGGLPATGKTAISRELAGQIGAVHLRVDSIEEAMRSCGPINPPLDEAGYRVAYAIAEDNLRIGRTVIADSVNPLTVTRDSWIQVASRAGVRAVEIEVLCTDAQEHRRRVEMRKTDVPGLKLPSWREVLSREYHPWNRDHIVIDTVGVSVEETVAKLRGLLPLERSSRPETKCQPD